MKLYIKNMVSNRCKIAVKGVLENNNIHYAMIDLGEVEITADISAEQQAQLKFDLQSLGLELIDDKKGVLVEKVKSTIIEMVHYSDDILSVKFSDFLSRKLGYDYTYLSNIFSVNQGTTIEKYTIAQKIERIKELIIYGEYNLTEIAWKMNYSSVAHLSNQFKKSTGLSPTSFKQMQHKRRSPIDEIGNINNSKQQPIPSRTVTVQSATVAIRY